MQVTKYGLEHNLCTPKRKPANSQTVYGRKERVEKEYRERERKYRKRERERDNSDSWHFTSWWFQFARKFSSTNNSYSEHSISWLRTWILSLLTNSSWWDLIFGKNFPRVSRRDKSDKLSTFSLLHFLPGNRESDRVRERKWERKKLKEWKKSRREKMRTSTDERVSTHHFQDFIDFSFKRSDFVFGANLVVVFFLSISFLILDVKTSGSNNSLLEWSSSYTLRTLHFFAYNKQRRGRRILS